MTRNALLSLTLACFIGLGLSVEARAAAVQRDVQSLSLPDFSRQSFEGDWLASGQLAEVVRLIASGKRDEGRVKLGQFMKEHREDPRAFELAATLLIEEGKYETAEEALTRAVMLEPRRVSAIVKLGIVLLLGEKQRGAEIALNKALEYAPDEPLALRYLAWLEQRRGQTRPVIGYLQRLLATDWVAKDRITEVHLVLAQSYNAVEQWAATKDLLEPLVLVQKVADPNQSGAFALLAALIGLGDIDTVQKLIVRLRQAPGVDDPRVRLAEAGLTALKGDTKGAIDRYRAVAREHPDYAGLARYRIALVYSGRKQWDEAARELEASAEAASPEEIGGVLSELSAAHLAAARSDKALQALDRFARKFPAVDAIPYLKAEVLSKGGNLEAARRELVALTGRAETYSAAFYLLGVVEWQLGHVDNARTAARRVVTLRPDDVQGWLTLAGMYDEHQIEAAQAAGKHSHSSGGSDDHAGDHKHDAGKPHDHGDNKNGSEPHSHGTDSAMVAVLEEALQANPGHPELLYERATLAYADGDVRAAQKLYETVLQRVPDHVPALNNLALSIVQTSDDPKRAGPMIDRARAIAPQHPAVLDTLGWFLVRTGRTAEAMQVLEAVVQAVPDDAIVKFHLGVAYWDTGRTKDALALIEAALAHGLPAIETVEAKVVLEKAKRKLREG